MKKKYFYGVLFLIFTFSCNYSVENTSVIPVNGKNHNNAIIGENIIALSITAHGGDRYDEASFRFLFRDKVYQFINFGKQYEYSRQQILKGDTILDVLSEQNFQRIINGKPVTTKETESIIYSESINSVIYFATLPHKLVDKSVIKNYKGQNTIKNVLYDVVKISFNEEGGGKDYDDIFYYWLNAETHQIDYLGYQYARNGGGIRFRSAYNKRKIGGIVFQDYINYSAPLGTPLNKLPQLFEQGELDELSRIDTEKIENLQ